MSALHTRASMVAGDDFYLTPLAHLKDEPELLEDMLAPWVERETEMEPIFLPEEGQDPDPELAIGHGFEISRTQQAEVDGQVARWQERLLVVRSHQYEQTTKKWLHRCLEKAEKALQALIPPSRTW